MFVLFIDIAVCSYVKKNYFTILTFYAEYDAEIVFYRNRRKSREFSGEVVVA